MEEVDTDKNGYIYLDEFAADGGCFTSKEVSDSLNKRKMEERIVYDPSLVCSDFRGESEIRDSIFFFNMPVEEKEKFAQREDDVQGFGQAFVFSEEQKLDWADMFYMLTLPADMRKPHLFPYLPLSFRETLEAYSVEVNNLAMKIFKVMAKALGMKHEDIAMFLEQGQQSVRINNYPPWPHSTF